MNSVNSYVLCTVFSNAKQKSSSHPISSTLLQIGLKEATHWSMLDLFLLFDVFFLKITCTN